MFYTRFNQIIRFCLPKGRMYNGVAQLLNDHGLRISKENRNYRPKLSLIGFETKILKPQAIIEMLNLGTRDLGFAGADWVEEMGANLVELIDTKIDPVKIVAAAPKALLHNGKLPQRSYIVASEYVNIVQNWLQENKIEARIIHSYGATEVYPPDDADFIVDNISSGTTLKANNLTVVEVITHSTTRLYASYQAMDNLEKREVIEDFVSLISIPVGQQRQVENQTQNISAFATING